MWNLMTNNAQILNVGVSVGTLLVWLFYAHLLFASFRRTRQSQILIMQGWGNSIDSICLINNMSEEAIHIVNIGLTLYTTDMEHQVSATDFEASPDDIASSGSTLTRQGPLPGEQYINIGTFRSLTQYAARAAGLSEDNNTPVETLGLHGLKITVIAIYGSGGTYVAAQRRFKAHSESNDCWQAQSIYTHQLRGLFARRYVRRWVKDSL